MSSLIHPDLSHRRSGGDEPVMGTNERNKIPTSSHPRPVGDVLSVRTNENLHHAVADAMAGIVAGDQGAIWELHRLAEPSLRRLVRFEARRVNAWISEDDVFDLTLDAAMVLARMARAWKPGVALPWVWARQRITSLVHQHLGQFTREIEESHLEIEEPVAVTSIEEPRLALRALAGRHEGAERLDRRLAEVVRDRDADIWLGFQLEKAGGNRSPAVTVAADYGMRPDAVRKVVQRVGERLGPDAIAA